jgi:hypothetical protein
VTPSRMPRRHTAPPPKWMHHGATVWFFPTTGSPECYAGVVDGEPWLAGSGTWCVNLHRMEEGYRNGRGRVAGTPIVNVAPRVLEGEEA